MKIETINRINQRDGTSLILEVKNGTPLCPHCRKAMVRVQGYETRGETWQNAMCACWWVGMDDGIYPKQVVVATDATAEAEYRASLDDDRKLRQEREAEAEFKDRLEYSAGDSATRFEIIQRRRYLHGKRQRNARLRVRMAIQAGADFDQAMNA